LQSGNPQEVTEKKKRMKKEVLKTVSDSSVIAASRNGKEQNVASQCRETLNLLWLQEYSYSCAENLWPRVIPFFLDYA
jgi:hypothetical protein